MSPSEELPETIIINQVQYKIQYSTAQYSTVTILQVATPPLPAAAPRTPARSGPTPPDKRVLDQREFDRKLRAKQVHYITIQYSTVQYSHSKQAFFSAGRSMSLASFRLPARLRRKTSGPSPRKTKEHVT